MLIKDPPVEVTENLLMLGTSEYPLYLFKGEREGVIFEGGISSMGPLLREQWAQLGLGNGFVKQLVVGHAHPDHVLAIPAIREMFPDVAVLASHLAVKTLSNEKALSFFCKADAGFNEAMLERGAIAEEHLKIVPPASEIAVDRVLKEGDTVVAAPATFKVLETPGHSECSLSFHDVESGVLLVSDATGYYKTEDGSRWPNYFSGYGAYLDSMRRLAALDAEILFLGHNTVIKGADDIRAYFGDALSATEQYHDSIIGKLKAGMTAREVAEELGTWAYEQSRLQPLKFFQRSCGGLVAMSMQHEGMSVDG